MGSRCLREGVRVRARSGAIAGCAAALAVLLFGGALAAAPAPALPEGRAYEMVSPVKGHVYLARPLCGNPGQAACTEQPARAGEHIEVAIQKYAKRRQRRRGCDRALRTCQGIRSAGVTLSAQV
jgi:hypothetical protein